MVQVSNVVPDIKICERDAVLKSRFFAYDCVEAVEYMLSDTIEDTEQIWRTHLAHKGYDYEPFEEHRGLPFYDDMTKRQGLWKETVAVEVSESMLPHGKVETDGGHSDSGVADVAMETLSQNSGSTAASGDYAPSFQTKALKMTSTSSEWVEIFDDVFATFTENQAIRLSATLRDADSTRHDTGPAQEMGSEPVADQFQDGLLCLQSPAGITRFPSPSGICERSDARRRSYISLYNTSYAAPSRD